MSRQKKEGKIPVSMLKTDSELYAKSKDEVCNTVGRKWCSNHMGERSHILIASDIRNCVPGLGEYPWQLHYFARWRKICAGFLGRIMLQGGRIMSWSNILSWPPYPNWEMVGWGSSLYLNFKDFERAFNGAFHNYSMESPRSNQHHEMRVCPQPMVSKTW